MEKRTRQLWLVILVGGVVIFAVALKLFDMLMSALTCRVLITSTTFDVPPILGWLMLAINSYAMLTSTRQAQTPPQAPIFIETPPREGKRTPSPAIFWVLGMSIFLPLILVWWRMG